MKNRVMKLFKSQIVEDMHEYLKKKYENLNLTSSDSLFESRFIFNPNQTFISFWNVFIAFVLIYSAFANPYTLSFTDMDKGGPILMIDIVIDFFFLIDLALNFNLAYFDEEGRLVKDRRQVVVNYIRTWFFLDAISSFPFSLIEVFSNQDSEIWIRIKTVPRLFRLSRVFKILKSLERLESIDFFMAISQRAWRLFRVLFGLILAIHICACLWHYSAKIQEFDAQTWVRRCNLTDMPAEERYLASVYWALTTLATIGYGDITPRSIIEKIISMIWMILGVYALSFSVGSLAAAAASTETKDRLVNQKIALIEKFGRMSNIPKAVLHTVKRYIRLNSESSGISDASRTSMLNGLNTTLKYEVALNIFRKSIRKFVFFSTRSESFIANIAVFLVSEVFNKNDLIWRSGEAAQGVFFINSGMVSFHVGKDNLKFYFMKEGHHFGDYEVVKKIERKFTVRACRVSEMLCLDNRVFDRIAQDFPRVWEDIEKLAVIRTEKMFQHAAEIVVLGMVKDEEDCDVLDIQEKIVNQKKNIRNKDKVKKEDLSGIQEQVDCLSLRVAKLEEILADWE
jgi:hyperpolarization activated cyclic nucleotide-gated potassium channel 1